MLLDQGSSLRQVGTLSLNLSQTPVNLGTYLGDHHRKQRKLLNPLFNVNHMRYMMPIFNGVTQQVLPIYCVHEQHRLNLLSFVRV